MGLDLGIRDPKDRREPPALEHLLRVRVRARVRVRVGPRVRADRRAHPHRAPGRT